MWENKWYYIDLYKDNTAIKFQEYENRNKTTRFQRFTGILDKNGKEIYEGDILGYKDRKQKPIIVKQEIFFCEEYGDYIGYPYKPELEVIGNIYKNPEMLK